MSFSSTSPIRGASLAIGTALGAVSAAAGFDNGSTLGSTAFSQLLYGVGFVAIVALTWVLPPYIGEFWSKGQYLASVICGVAAIGFALIVIAFSAGNAAKHRTNGVAEREALIKAYARAEKELEGVRVELTAAREAKLFKRTASCGNDTEDASRVFCDNYRRLDARRAAAETVLASKPMPADPQAEMLAWATGFDQATIAKGWPLALSITVEIGAILAFWLAAASGTTLPSPQEARRAAITLEATTIAPKGKTPVHALPRKAEGQFILPAPKGIRMNLDGRLNKTDLAKTRKAVAND